MPRKITLLLILLMMLSASAQIPMGQWRTHFAYSNVYQIDATADKVYGTSQGALFSVNVDDEEIEYYSTLTGLNGASVHRIACDSESGKLIITYENGNIDILDTRGDIFNIPDLYNKQIPFTKHVHNINIAKQRAYLSTNFGIVVVNIARNEIAETYYISNSGSETVVNSTAIVGDSIFAATESGIRAAAMNSNLMNYEVWKDIELVNNAGEQIEGECSLLLDFNDKLYSIINYKLYRRDGNSWTPLIPQYGIYNARVTDNSLMISVDNSFFVVSNDGETFTDIHLSNEYKIQDITKFHGYYWAACGQHGIVRYDNQQKNINSFVPNGPLSNTSFRLKFAGEKLFALQGGRKGVEYGRAGHVMMFKDETWTNIHSDDIQQQTQLPIHDFMDVAVDNVDDSHFLITSYGTGAYEFRDNKFYKHHNESNSPLKSVVANKPNDYLRLDGGMTDNEGNMYILNVHMPNVINILKPDGTWTSLSHRLFDGNVIGAGIIQHSQHPELKIFVSALSNTGIIFWYDNGTPFDVADDRIEFITAPVDQDGNIINDVNYYCNPVEDLNGEIWVGTNNGILIFPDPIKAIGNSDYRCRRVKIPRNDGTGLADYLLDNEQVNSIAVDGANRKWIGTETSGVYLVSETGQETIKHFTTNNSPLLSDNILAVAINQRNGEVFFGTGNGLISYMSDATLPFSDFSNIKAYPNPIRENYSGVVTITGLMTASTVKIANMAGEIVCDTQSNGGTAVWDLRTKNGKRVSSGIYWIIAFNEDGSERGRTKILIIK